MGIDYSFRLCYGFELDDEIVEGAFRRSKEDQGSFHMEDRFDPKTGAKVQPEKVWDQKPNKKTWIEIDGKQYADLDPEEWESFLEEKLDCNVEQFGSWPTGEITYVFYVNKPIPYKEAEDYGKITVYNNSISQAEIEELAPKALQLKSKLEKLGYTCGEPRVFIAVRIS